MFFSKPAGLQYVVRNNPADYDFTLPLLIADATWRTLSISSVVPANAKMVYLRLVGIVNAVNRAFSVKKVGETSGINVITFQITVANYSNNAFGFVDCTGQQISYYAASGVWTYLGILVLGWFI